jgi:hypothetical protein
MKNTQLKFDTIGHLWKFKEEIKANHIRVITDELLLICDLSAQQIDLAVSHFNARVFKELSTDSYSHNKP